MVYARRMEDALIIIDGPEGSSIPARIARGMTPALFVVSEQAQRKFWEFFTAHIRNPNTRRAYLIAVWRFADWCGFHGISLAKVEPMLVAAYVEELTGKLAPASVKQHLAAIRIGLFQHTAWIGRPMTRKPVISTSKAGSGCLRRRQQSQFKLAGKVASSKVTVASWLHYRTLSPTYFLRKWAARVEQTALWVD